jgi:hypothetical protein
MLLALRYRKKLPSRAIIPHHSKIKDEKRRFMRKLQDTHGLDDLLESGGAGFYPLFYQDWIVESVSNRNDVAKMTFTRAAENVHRVYKNLERHCSLERKKTAISALNTEERNEFILSFIKMVEYRTLDRVRELH